MRGDNHREGARPARVEFRIVERGFKDDAGIVDQNIEATPALDDALDHGRALRSVRHIEHPTFCAAASGLDFIDHCLHFVGVEIADRDMCAFVREQMRGRAPHATGGAGDKGDFIFNTAAEF